MEVLLNSIALRNFKLYQDETFHFERGKNVICGHNASGKTTIKNALLWCLTGVDEDGKKDGSAIRTVGAPIEACPDVTVTLTIDGVVTTFRRVLEATFTGRGADKTYKGDASACFIDSVPVNVSEFASRLKEYFPIEPSLWLDVYYFAEKMSADERRELLVSNFATLTDEDIFDRLPQYAELRELAKSKSVDVIKAQNKEIEKSCTAALGRGKTIGTLQARIDECFRSIIPNVSSAEIISKDIASIEDDIAALSITNDTTEKRKAIDLQIKELTEGEQTRRRDVYKESHDKWQAALSEAENRRGNLIQQRRDIESEQNAVSIRYDNLENDVLVAENELAGILADKYEPNEICPTCGQQIPKAQIEEAAANYYEHRAIKQEQAEARIQSLKKQIDEAEALLQTLSTELSEIKDAVSKCNIEIAQLEGKEPTMPPESKGYLRKKAALMADMEALEAPSIDPAAISALTNRLKAKQSELADAKFNEKQTSRIAELKAEQSKMNEALTNAQRIIAMCDEFTLAKATLIEDEISSHFGGVRFKLFDIYKNGEIKNVCKMLVNDKEYRILSFSQKILSSVAVIEGLSKHFGFYAPLAIDNSSEIDENSMYSLSQTGRQMLFIKVTDGPLTVYAE